MVKVVAHQGFRAVPEDDWEEFLLFSIRERNGSRSFGPAFITIVGFKKKNGTFEFGGFLPKKPLELESPVRSGT